MEKTNWNEHPALKKIDERKRKILINFLEQNEGRKPEELIPYLVSMNTELNRMGLSFTNDETDLLLDAIKENMTFEEKKRIDIIKGIIRRK